MKPLNILIDGRMLSDQVHGISRYTSGLIDGLRDRGQNVTVLGQSIKCALPFAHPLETVELYLKTKNTNYDVYHFPSFAVPLHTRPSTVITIHDLIHFYDGGLSHKLYYRSVVKSALKKAQGIIAVSEWTKNEIHRQLGVKEERITVIRNGLEKKFTAQGSAESSVSPRFLCLTNLKKHKNAITLIQAAQTLWRKNYKFDLDISLSGADIPEEWALNSEEKSHVHVLKRAPDEEILQKLRSCRALISPSVYEGFNYPVAEALALGKEVILSLGSAHDEFKSPLIQFYGTPHDAAALAEAMERALKQPPLQSREHNIRTLDAVVDETLELYRRVAYDFAHER